MGIYMIINNSVSGFLGASHPAFGMHPMNAISLSSVDARHPLFRPIAAPQLPPRFDSRYALNQNRLNKIQVGHLQQYAYSNDDLEYDGDSHKKNGNTVKAHNSPLFVDRSHKANHKKACNKRSMKLKPGVAAESMARTLAYVLVHPTVLMRVRSIKEGLATPRLSLAKPVSGLVECAVISGLEYLLAFTISRHIDKFIAHSDPGSEEHKVLNKVKLLCKNVLSSTITAGSILPLDRVMQQRVLGDSFEEAFKHILGMPLSELPKNIKSAVSC